MNQSVSDRPYFPISHYFRQRFGSRVGKISVSVAQTCPNRNGNTNQQPCIFCDEWGSAAYHLERDRSLLDQIRHNKKLVLRRMKCEQFLVYFQSYTNTLDRVALLRDQFEMAIQEDGIKGLVIGTRPDCLPKRIFSLLDDMSKKTYTLVELGVQSFFDDQLEYLKRGHTRQQNIDAVHALSEQTGVDIGIHLIFGLPNETHEQLIETAQIVNQLPVSNVKLHNLHVLKNTTLAQYHANGEFEPDDLETYAEKVILFLRHLSPNIAIQRLAALSNRWDELIAPQWTRLKMAPLNYIENRMNEEGVKQGDLIQNRQGTTGLLIGQGSIET